MRLPCSGLRRDGRRLRWLLPLLALGALGIGLGVGPAAGWLGRHWSDQLSLPLPVGLLVLALCMLAALVPMAHEMLCWHRPFRRLRRTLGEVRAGEAPIADVLQVKGSLHPLTPLLTDLLRDLRQREADLNALEENLRQRIANRTDALQRLVGSLKYQASTDALTLLRNRRALDEYLPQVLQQCLGETSDLGLLMMDVDHFKLLNDTLGHAAGDRLLHTFGRLIRSSMRQQDAGFRYGGDEFIAVLPRSQRPQAQALADRLMTLSEQLGRTLRLPRCPRLSIGVCMLSELQQPDAQSLLQQADRALYAAKRSRGNPAKPLADRTAVATMPRSD